jgi:hypothetical protein
MKKTIITFKSGVELLPFLAECKKVSSVFCMSTKTLAGVNKKSKRDKSLRLEDELKGTVYKFGIKYGNIRGDLAAYTNYVNMNRIKEGLEPNFEAKRLPYGQWFNDYGVIIDGDKKGGNFQMRFYYHNALARNSRFVYGYEDGTPLTDVELTILQDYLKPVKKGSGRQGTEKVEIVNNIKLDNILSLNVLGKRFRKK